MHLATHRFDASPVASTLRRKALLTKTYQQIAEDGREQMMKLYMECADNQRFQTAMDFESLWEQTIQRDARLPIDQRLSDLMIELLQKRFACIEMRITCINNYHIELLRTQRVSQS